MFLEFISRQYRNQFAAVVAANLIAAGYGITVGWTAPIIPLLQSPDSPLPAGPISTAEASWIGSVMGFGGVTGTLLIAPLHTYFGKKVALLSLAVPHIILWTLLYLGDNVYYIYAARVLAGITGGGMFALVPLFVADIADRRIRGTLGSLTVLHINFGLLAVYTAGNYLSYYTIPQIMICLPVAFAAFVSLLPDTPYCLLRKGRLDDAEKSLMFYRNVAPEDLASGAPQGLAFVEEFENWKVFVRAEDDKEKLSLADFATPAAIRGMSIGIFLMAMNIYTGLFAIVTYAGNILIASGTSIDPKHAMSALAIVIILGNLTSFAIIDKAGRKVFLIISNASMGTFHAILGIHAYLFEADPDIGFAWLPVVCLAGTIFSATLGVTNIPYFVLPEILPAKIRSIGCTICFVLMSSMAFVLTKTFPMVLEQFKLYGAVGVFSTVCATSIVIIIFWMPETKGKNLIVEEKDGKTVLAGKGKV
ncbi:facilitated trehalose transporter Tret1-like [Culex pipiens pallens]|uniref:facilitated trehalose transporter Tret1-like n=1 Tax=Culex pipiens pallens TaxID=42434 RepID=UPI0019534F43|nr:facilitated trehalose transporter Tret1-like [Culex pipiens pallens]